MRVYIPKIKITTRTVYWYPFSFISDRRQLMYEKRTKKKLRKHFNNLTWDKTYVWDRTRFCGSLKEATARLRDELLESFGMDRKWLHPIAESMIMNRFKEDWS